MASWDIGRYKDARKRTERQRAVRIFVAHLVACVLGNVAIGLWNAGTYYLRDNEEVWFYLPLIFWGVGVLVHYLVSVALFDNWWDGDERQISERMRR